MDSLQKLDENRDFFQQRADESENLVFIIDKNLKFNFFNKKWLNYRKTDLTTELERSIEAFVHTDDVSCFYEMMTDVSFHNEPRILEFRLMDEQEGYKWLTGVITPKFTDTGIFVGCVAYCTDFTDRKLYTESMQRFWSIITNVDIGIVLKDKHGKITDWNKGAENILGYTAEDVIGNTSDMYLPAKQQEEIKIINKNVAEKLQSSHVWIKSRHKDGRIVISYASFTPILDINNKFAGSFVMFRDMTEEKLAEEKSRNMAAIFKIADAGVILKNAEGKITDWNAGAENILGYPREEMIGKTSKYYAPPESYQLIDEIEVKNLQGMHTAHVEVVRKHKDGRHIVCSASYTPILGDDGKLLGSVAIFHDITDKKIAEQKAKNLAAIFLGVDAGIVFKDTNGLITEWNVGSQNILGYTAYEVIGHNSADYTPPEYIDLSNEIDKRVNRGEHIAHTELVRKHKNGDYVNISASLTPIRDENGNVSGSVVIFHDITEKIQIEKKHKELENTLTNLFDNLSNGFCLYELVKTDDGNEDLKVVMANRAFAQLLGEPYESLPGRLFSEVCAGDAELLPDYISVAKTGKGISFESYSKFYHKHIHAVIYSPVNGQAAVIISDRSHLVEAERALKERENNLALLFSSMTSGFCLGKVVKDSNGEVVSIIFEIVNKAFEEMEEYKSVMQNGKMMRPEDENPYFSIFVDVAVNRVKKSYKKYISSRNVTLEVLCFSPQQDYFVCLESDITERVKAEEELEKAYRDTAAILSEIPAPICVVGKKDGKILGSNGAFTKMCQSNGTSSINGTNINDYFKIYDNKACTDILENICAGVNFTCNMTRFDGSETEVQVFSRPMFYNEQDAFAVYCIDLTQQRMQEQVLRMAANAAEDASKMKTFFLANMSHEIRTPLNGVIGFAELALDDQGVGEKLKEYLNKIRLSAYGLLDIINDVLDISKIESGKVEVEKVPFSLHDIFRHCEAVSSTKAMEKGIILYFYSEPYIGKRLIGDPTKLRQVLLNLLSNAIKFTNVGIVKVMSIAEIINGNQFKIYFEVKDSGIGMSKEQLQKVFDPFMQADSSTTRKYGGTGLGLAITRSLIELMGGKIEAESLQGVGSRFSFTLIFDSIEVSSEELEHSDAKMSLVNKPIFEGDALICEDNEINQQVIKEHLLRIGIKPTVVSNGKTGVETAKTRMMQNKPFDIILMDIHMPIMDGLEATQKLLELGCKTPIIAMTANVMSKDREDYLAQGMSDYIGKPFVSHELWTCLLRYLKPVELSSVIDEDESVNKNKDKNKEGIIDSSLGIERSAGNKKLYEHLKRDFLKSNTNTYNELKKVLESGDIKLAHRMAHSIKGVAGTIGATRLYKAAYDVESSLSGEKALLSENLLKSFKFELEAVLNELSYIKNDTDEEYTNERILDKAAAKELTKTLEPLLRSGDSYSLDLLVQAKEVLVPIGALYEDFVTQVEDYEFEKAYETLESINQLLEE